MSQTAISQAALPAARAQGAHSRGHREWPPVQPWIMEMYEVEYEEVETAKRTPMACGMWWNQERNQQQQRATQTQQLRY